MRRQGNHPSRQTRLFALIAFLLLAAAFASFLLLSSASSTTTNAQSYTKFKAVSGHGNNICGIKEADGNPECWGLIDFDPLPNGGGRLPTDGGYVSPCIQHLATIAPLRQMGPLSVGATARRIGSTIRKWQRSSITIYGSRLIMRAGYSETTLTPANDQKVGCAANSCVDTPWDIRGR